MSLLTSFVFCQSQILWLAQMVGTSFYPTICFSEQFLFALIFCLQLNGYDVL
jgi:hypothetical protein